MFDSLRAFATHIHRQLKVVGFSAPTRPVLRALLEVVYQASLRTEEGRHIQGSVTFADPAQPELILPRIRRADYPGFTKLGRPIPLTPSNLVKLARAVDSWVGSIAVHATTADSLSAWGIVDQLVHHNIGLHHESEGGAPNPGLVTIQIEGVGDLVAYHSGLFLGAIRHHELIRREHDALRSQEVRMQARSALQPFAKHIVNVLDNLEVDECLDELEQLWESTLARLAIGIRRKGTGGSLLISGSPLASHLSIGYLFRYERLRDSVILSVLDRNYFSGGLVEIHFAAGS